MKKKIVKRIGIFLIAVTILGFAEFASQPSGGGCSTDTIFFW